MEGQPIPRPEDRPGAIFRVVYPRYFETMRIPLVTGREFNDHDLADSPRVAIVNQTMARRHWPSIDPVGKRFRINSSTPWVTIVGVARDAEQSDWGSPAGNEYYFPYTQNPEDFNATSRWWRALQETPPRSRPRSNMPSGVWIATFPSPTSKPWIKS